MQIVGIYEIVFGFSFRYNNQPLLDIHQVFIPSLRVLNFSDSCQDKKDALLIWETITDQNHV